MKKKYYRLEIDIKEKTMTEPLKIAYGTSNAYFDKDDVMLIVKVDFVSANPKDYDKRISSYIKRRKLKLYTIHLKGGVYIKNIILTDKELDYLCGRQVKS